MIFRKIDDNEKLVNEPLVYSDFDETLLSELQTAVGGIGGDAHYGEDLKEPCFNHHVNVLCLSRKEDETLNGVIPQKKLNTAIEAINCKYVVDENGIVRFYRTDPYTDTDVELVATRYDDLGDLIDSHNPVLIVNNQTFNGTPSHGETTAKRSTVGIFGDPANSSEFQVFEWDETLTRWKPVFEVLSDGSIKSPTIAEILARFETDEENITALLESITTINNSITSVQNAVNELDDRVTTLESAPSSGGWSVHTVLTSTQILPPDFGDTAYSFNICTIPANGEYEIDAVIYFKVAPPTTSASVSANLVVFPLQNIYGEREYRGNTGDAVYKDTFATNGDPQVDITAIGWKALSSSQPQRIRLRGAGILTANTTIALQGARDALRNGIQILARSQAIIRKIG